MERLTRVVSAPRYRSHGRFWVDAERTKVVPEESPEAAFLLANTNTMIPLEEAVKFGIADKDGNPLDPYSGERLRVDEQGEVVDKMVRGPRPANDSEGQGQGQAEGDDGEGKEKRTIETLEDIKGLGPSTREALEEHGVDSIEALMETPDEDILAFEIQGLTAGKVQDFKRQVEAAQGDGDDDGDDSQESE